MFRRMLRWDNTATVVWLLFLGGGVLRFLGLGRESFWFNEAASYYYAKGTLWNVVMHSFRDETNPPGFHVLIHFWMGWFGISEKALRLPSALIGSLTLPLMYLFARCFLSRRGALFAVGLLAFSPLHVWYSQECRGFAFFVFFVLLAYLFFLYWLESGRLRYLLLNCLFILFAVSFHYFGLHVVLLENLFFLHALLTQRKICWRTWFLSQALLLAGLTPFLVMMGSVDPANVTWWRESGIKLSVLKSLVFHLNGVYFLLERDRFVKVLVLSINGAMFLLGAIALRSGRGVQFLLPAMLLPIAINICYSLVISPILGNAQSAGRYFLFTLPPFLVVLSSGWERLFQNDRFRGFALILLLVFCACSWANLRAIWTNTVFQRDDNRRLCSLLLSRARAGDWVMASPVMTVDYYRNRLGFAEKPLRLVSISRYFQKEERHLPQEVPRVWLYFDPIHHFESLIREIQREHHLRVVLDEREEKMQGVGLLLLEKRDVGR